MKAVSEKSFGARLRASQDLVKVLAQISYIPARPSESVVAMTALCDSIVTVNATVVQSMQDYNMANKSRTQLFRTDAHSVVKILSPIRKYVDAFYGKESIQARQVASIIERLRATKATVLPSLDPDVVHTISNSEQSFGSLTQAFNDLVNTLKTFQGYAPAILHLKITALEAQLIQITSLNDAVIDYLTTLRIARTQRTNLYTDLHDKSLRIKSLISASFGNTSNEYKMIRKLGV